MCEIIEQLQKIKQPTQKTINICHVSANMIFKERISIYITIIQDFVLKSTSQGSFYMINDIWHDLDFHETNSTINKVIK